MWPFALRRVATAQPEFGGTAALRFAPVHDHDDAGLAEAASGAVNFASLIETAPDAIVIVDSNATIAIVNERAEELFGYPRHELVGSPIELLVPERLRERHRRERDGYIAAPRRRPMGIGLDLLALRRDGTEVPVEISLSPLRTNGRLMVTSVVRDISERRRLEREADRATVELRAQRAENRLRREALRRTIAAQEDERTRIARELHDESAQALTGVTFGLRRAVEAEDIEEARSEVARQGEAVKRVLGELRRISQGLRPSALDDLGLVAALEQLADNTAAGLDVSFDHPGFERRLDKPVETAIYRIVQEALTNAIRHAGASKVRIELVESSGRLTALVRDDGVGFDPAMTGGGLGLEGMRERAELVGGELRVDSGRGLGTEVTLTLPLRE